MSALSFLQSAVRDVPVTDISHLVRKRVSTELKFIFRSHHKVDHWLNNKCKLVGRLQLHACPANHTAAKTQFVCPHLQPADEQASGDKMAKRLRTEEKPNEEEKFVEDKENKIEVNSAPAAEQ